MQPIRQDLQAIHGELVYPQGIPTTKFPASCTHLDLLAKVLDRIQGVKLPVTAIKENIRNVPRTSINLERSGVKMPWRDVMQVCLNGHHINSAYQAWPQYNKDYCDKCGETTVIKCPDYGNPIPGDMQDTGVSFIGWELVVPSHCTKCGKPFPWASHPEASQPVEAVDTSDILKGIFVRLHALTQLLRKRHDNRETLDVRDEFDVQDFLHILLRLHFDDIRTEEWTPSYAGKSAMMDFLLKDQGIVVGLKWRAKGWQRKK